MCRLCLISLLVVTSARISRADDHESARAAVQGYKQHFDRFDRLTFRARNYGSELTPDTLDEALDTQRWRRTKSTDIFVAIDGDKWLVRIDQEETPPDLKQLAREQNNPSTLWVPSPVTTRYLSNGTESLSFQPSYDHASLFENGDLLRDDGARNTPLHVLGFRNPPRNPYELLVQSDRARQPWGGDPPVVIEGVGCVPVWFEPDNGHRIIFYLAPDRGFLPLRIHESWTNAKGEADYVRTDVLETRQLSGGRWAPIRVRTVDFRSAATAKFLPYMKEITEIDADRRPTPEELSIDLPAGTIIDRQAKLKMKWSVQLKQGERIGPDDLHRIIDISEGRQEDPLLDTAIHPPPLPWWQWTLIAAGGVAVLLGLVLAVRATRGRTTPTGGSTP